MSYHGREQMLRFAQWSVVSCVISGYEWVFSNPACDGWAKFPTFGITLAKWQWNFNFQTPLVGIGLMAPAGVAWSMLVGAILSWGVLWPVLGAKAGVWYPADLGAWDGRGLFGNQVCLAMGLVLADGLYTLTRALVEEAMVMMGLKKKKKKSKSRRRGGSRGSVGSGSAGSGSGGRGARPRSSRGSILSGSSGPGSVASGASSVASSTRRKWRADALAAIDNDALSDASALTFSMAAYERGLRRYIFMSCKTPYWSGGCLVLAAGLLVVAAFSMAPLLSPLTALRWYHVLAAAAGVPLIALANTRATGATDVNVAAPFAVAAVMLFAVWGGAAGGVGVALPVAGLVLGAAQSAAELGYSFAAGYVAMASPFAVFLAHVAGCLAGALFAPFTYTLLLEAAAASPLAAPMRAAAAMFAAGGAAALPAYSMYAGGAALVVGLLLAGAREAMPHERVRALVPMPVVMGVIFISGANIAGARRLGGQLGLPKFPEPPTHRRPPPSQPPTATPQTIQPTNRSRRRDWRRHPHRLALAQPPRCRRVRGPGRRRPHRRRRRVGHRARRAGGAGHPGAHLHVVQRAAVGVSGRWSPGCRMGKLIGS
jgi:hypothetical protein